MHRAFIISPGFSFDMNICMYRYKGIGPHGFSRQGTYVFLLINLRKSVIKVISMAWFKILTWLKFNSEPPELFFGVFFLMFFQGAYGVPLDFDFTSLVMTYWQPQYFDFFNRHHFFFHISFAPPSVGSSFDDAGFVAFSGLLCSLPFNLHLFYVCLFHKVQFGLEDLRFQGGTSDPSPLLDFNLHLFSSNLLFGLGRSICYSQQVFLSHLGLG